MSEVKDGGAATPISDEAVQEGIQLWAKQKKFRVWMASNGTEEDEDDICEADIAWDVWLIENMDGLFRRMERMQDALDELSTGDFHSSMVRCIAREAREPQQ